MGRDRRRRFALAGAAVVAAGIVLTLVVVAQGGDDAPAVATGASTTTSSAPGGDLGTAPSSIPVASTAPPTSPAPTAPSAPVTTASTAPPRCPRPAPGSDFDGFGATEIVVDNADGSHRSCVLTADTPSRQEQGLMRQDDLDGYDGMIFRFASAEERSFWMRNTSIPLSIAFFDAGGAFVSATDMDPCGDSPNCPTYSSHGAAKFALEVVRDRLPAAGASPGSRLVG